MKKAQKAKEAYDKAMNTLEKIIDDFNASSDQIDEARSASRTSAAAFLNVLLDDVAQRTQALQTLIDQLNKVITSLQKNPIGNALNTLNNVVTSANEIVQDDGSTDNGSN